MTSNGKTQRACEVFGYIVKGSMIGLCIYVALTGMLGFKEGYGFALFISVCVGYLACHSWYEKAIMAETLANNAERANQEHAKFTNNLYTSIGDK